MRGLLLRCIGALAVQLMVSGGFLTLSYSRVKQTTFKSLLATALLLGCAPAFAVPIIFTDHAAWEASILAVDATANFGIEEFTGADSHGNGPADGNGLGTGPHAFSFGSMTLSGIGDGPAGEFGGSQSGIHTNTMELRLVEDSSDFELFPGFFIEGEGVELATFDFSNPDNFAFSLDVSNFGHSSDGIGSHDGVDLTVNGITINLEDFTTNGAGFVGILDTDGISLFTLAPGQEDISNSFQQINIDELEFASISVPLPAAAWLFGSALGLLGWMRRRAA